MKAVKALKNQYLGINAHLNSYWQNDEDWSEFHTSYIVHISAALKAQLLPLGYTTGKERSLQIRRLDQPDSVPRSDVSIYDLDRTRAQSRVTPGQSGAYDLVLTLPEVLAAEENPVDYWAIAIYTADQTGQGKGEPVAWIEVLSPANKAGGQHAHAYRTKRRKLLDSGIVFVEIDYLHESAPTFNQLPAYRARDKDGNPLPKAHPYRILVIDPRPLITYGKLYVYHFDVDQPIPIVTIPLSRADRIDFDFGVPYERMLEMELFTLELVDYTQLPNNFNRYNPADQQRIAARMIAVLEATQQGLDLETGPFPTQPISLEEALTRIEAFQQA
ncbi:MAG: DUF4058 family protein [Caldilinea sp. CFX5]|nr:DUF4058 family protein [Caldilinea sp. CFX5]